ncbi:short-chain dehydrogenase reductase family [Fusarium tjaetaba]|uniref:Short-chain dehydrogenase reductase family n=1 Tax=Fusarium tjaetaba TaxID=1567544 RepID=A0A8H5S3A5_9HYPO|nr:short-chain dehydrogenase reductase family [Fusarium tjaetaba]KAF5643357.1 short-chain dehydrogenase reductase family [Fusarium tjaetaba]
MSANLKHQAATEATPFAFIWRQLFQSIPSIPNTVDLSGQVALITGSNIGLGFESARQLLALNLSHLILAVRSKQRGDAAAKRLQAEFSSAQIGQCETLPLLDIAILNAGLSQPTYTRAEETGHEITFQVNYLSTALLALILIPILREKRGTTSPARLSLVGSDTSYYANWKGRDSEPIREAMDNPASFDSWEAYKTTKLLLLMFTCELSKRIPSNEVIINVSNPGACRGTQFGHADRSMLEEAVLYVASLVLGRTATVGARQFPPIMYEQCGTALQNALWDETMRELAFADLRVF